MVFLVLLLPLCIAYEWKADEERLNNPWEDDDEDEEFILVEQLKL